MIPALTSLPQEFAHIKYNYQSTVLSITISCCDEGDSANAALRGEICYYLMDLECVRADAPIIIPEEGKSWRWQQGK